MKVSVAIPESLKDIKLSQYSKWLKISKDQDNSVFLQQKMIEIFCNIPLKAVNHIKVKDVEYICSKIVNSLEEKPKFKNRFKKENKEYGFIPQLDNMSFGEYVDLDTYLSDWETMDKAMSILYRPITHTKGDTYTIEDYEKADKYDMKNLSLDIVFGCMVFFYNLRKELQNHILNYLDNQEIVKQRPELMALVRSGVGISQSMDWQKATL